MTAGRAPTHDWTVPGDDYGSRRGRTQKLIGLVVLAFLGVAAVVYAVAVGASGIECEISKVV